MKTKAAHIASQANQTVAEGFSEPRPASEAWLGWRFSLRGSLSILLVAALAGLGADLVLHRYLRREILHESYRLAIGDPMHLEFGGNAPNSEYWYLVRSYGTPISRDAVDVAMRQALRLSAEPMPGELPLMMAQRRPDDEMAVYEIPGTGNQRPAQFAFLLRNEVVVCSAMKGPSDARFVEREEINVLSGGWMRGAVILSAMLAVLALFLIAILARALVRRWVKDEPRTTTTMSQSTAPNPPAGAVPKANGKAPLPYGRGSVTAPHSGSWASPEARA